MQAQVLTTQSEQSIQTKDLKIFENFVDLQVYNNCRLFLKIGLNFWGGPEIFGGVIIQAQSGTQSIKPSTEAGACAVYEADKTRDDALPTGITNGDISLLAVSAKANRDATFHIAFSEKATTILVNLLESNLRNPNFNLEQMYPYGIQPPYPRPTTAEDYIRQRQLIIKKIASKKDEGNVVYCSSHGEDSLPAIIDPERHYLKMYSTFPNILSRSPLASLAFQSQRPSIAVVNKLTYINGPYTSEDPFENCCHRLRNVKFLSVDFSLRHLKNIKYVSKHIPTINLAQ